MSAPLTPPVPPVEPPTAGPPGPSVPTRRVGPAWVGALALANAGTYVAFFGPIQALLPLQAEAISPTSKEAILALVTGIGAAVSMVANPVFGALSDRTRSRFGRRVPWVAGGALGGACGLLLLAVVPGVLGMILAWCVVQASVNAALAGVTAAIPDVVPVEQRAGVGGIVNLGQTLGVLLGVGLAVLFGGVPAGFVACAVFLLLAVLPYLRGSRDVPFAVAPDWAGWGAFARSFWISPRAHPDFALAWGTRFLVTLGNAVATVYLLFFLTDEVGLEDPAGSLLVALALYAVVTACSAVLAGWWSDRAGKRRIFVVVAGVVIAAGGLTLAFVATWTGVLVAAALLGAGFGAFLAVDLAIVTEVLPDQAARGKDLGVINIANALPQVLGPAIAAPLVLVAGGYTTLYVVAALISLVGSSAVWRIRGVP